jgi:hypothetical protein
MLFIWLTWTGDIWYRVLKYGILLHRPSQKYERGVTPIGMLFMPKFSWKLVYQLARNILRKHIHRRKHWIGCRPLWGQGVFLLRSSCMSFSVRVSYRPNCSAILTVFSADERGHYLNIVAASSGKTFLSYLHFYREAKLSSTTLLTNLGSAPYTDVSIAIMDIIYHPVVYLKQRVGGWILSPFSWNLLGWAQWRASLYLWTPAARDMRTSSIYWSQLGRFKPMT